MASAAAAAAAKNPIGAPFGRKTQWGVQAPGAAAGGEADSGADAGGGGASASGAAAARRSMWDERASAGADSPGVGGAAGARRHPADGGRRHHGDRHGGPSAGCAGGHRAGRRGRRCGARVVGSCRCQGHRPSCAVAGRTPGPRRASFGREGGISWRGHGECSFKGATGHWQAGRSLEPADANLGGGPCPAFRAQPGGHELHPPPDGLWKAQGVRHRRIAGRNCRRDLPCC
mmetsp:Transcript_135030/g.431463  ORF Transcript_135030/g.431463 Transcript_135030/m.431463 type:complete len:231 (-) Transcript_135030:1759-2451(-)